MFEINDVEIIKLPKVLTKQTIAERYYGLIQDADSNCHKLDAAGVKKGSDLQLVAIDNSELDILITKTNINKSYIQQLARLLSFMRFKPFPLKKLENIDSKYIENLISKGFKNTGDLLLFGKNNENRLKLSEEMKIPLEVFERIIKLADLMRLPGVRNTRAILYLESGLDCIQKFAMQDPVEARQYLITFVERTRITKIAPLQKELETQITWAKLYPILVEF